MYFTYNDGAMSKGARLHSVIIYINTYIYMALRYKNIPGQTPLDKLEYLEHKIETDTYINNYEIRTYIEEIIYLEKFFLTDKTTKEWKRLQRLHTYLKHLLNQHQKFQLNILTIIATIFLPLGVIVGFFGMNFKSMGAPSLKKGIFNTPHAQHYVFGLGLIASILVLVIYPK